MSVGQEDFALDTDPADSIGSIAAVLRDACRSAVPVPTLKLERTGLVLDPQDAWGGTDLRSGDLVDLVPPGTTAPPRPIPRSAHPVVAVVGGPDTGRTVKLPSGTTTIGRSSQCDITLADPTLSRRHVRVIVTDGRVEIEDADSANGTFIDGSPITGRQVIEAGTVVEAGSSLLRFDGGHAAGVEPKVARAGRVDFNRPPRSAQFFAPQQIELPAPPRPPTHRRLALTTILGPLVMGVPLTLLAVITGQMFLLIAGVASIVASPLLAAFSAYEERRSGTKTFEKDAASYRERLAAIAAELEHAVRRETESRRRDAPSAADLIDRATALRSTLWERRPNDADFLTFAIGWCDQPSACNIALADGGDHQLRAEVREVAGRHAMCRSVPVVVSCTAAGVIGMSGDSTPRDGVVRSIVLQLATLHSPRDVIICAAAADPAALTPLRWLPHTRVDGSPLQAPHLAQGADEARELIVALSDVIASRVGDARVVHNRDVSKRPSIVVVVDEQLGLPRTSLMRLLEDGPSVGVYTIWLGERLDQVPGECGVTIDVVDRPPSLTLRVPSSGLCQEGIAFDAVALGELVAATRSLTPVRDVTAGGASGHIPTFVSLLELLDMPEPNATAVAQRWDRAGIGAVAGPIGLGADGAFSLDLRSDGPHALVGGTTGAGKSELLQTLVASIAASHPPERVTFLLVDYKGGAAFKECVDLPHTVGMVTDLDGHLVDRVLVSLRAELRRRERVLHHQGAKDIIELERRDPTGAPAALVLVVDEFATLAKELPGFVDGVVSIAQLGRSLGIHLILATQRPAGAINDNIRANTNLRVALRMNDRADSQDVIDVADAASLPRTVPGRAYFRTGQSELNEVQVAYAGGSTAAPGTTPITIRPLGPTATTAVQPRPQITGGLSDLRRLVDAIGVAAAETRRAAPAPPWLLPLPASLPLASLAFDSDQGLPLGISDLPAEQARGAVGWRPGDGTLLIYGTSGSGKSTALRTLATALASSTTPDESHLYALDFSTGSLRSLERLPHCGAVIGGQEMERVQRLIATLERTLATRSEALTVAGVTHISEFRKQHPERPTPDVVVLLDGFDGFISAFEKTDFGTWIDRFAEVVTRGLPLGIHFALTANRANSIGAAITGTVGRRIVLRMGNEDDYAALGLDSRVARAVHLPPGRGFVGATVEVQLAFVGDDASGDRQIAALSKIAEGLRVRYPAAAVPGVGSLPTMVSRRELTVGSELTAMVGICQSTLEPVGFDLRDGNLLIAGPNRSGRSTALATLALALRSSTPGAQLMLFAPRRSPLTEFEIWSATATSIAGCEESSAALADDLHQSMATSPSTNAPVVLFVDDATELDDTMAAAPLAALARRGRDAQVFIIAAAESNLARHSYGGLIPELRRDRQGVLLMPDIDLDGDLLGARLARAHGLGQRPGRGVLVTRTMTDLVQVAAD